MNNIGWKLNQITGLTLQLLKPFYMVPEDFKFLHYFQVKNVFIAIR